MGILDKVKNLFTEEYEEEVPIKKEVKHVEITPPRRDLTKEGANTLLSSQQPIIKEEQKKTEAISDSTALNREERFKFPVYFDDEDFEDLPKSSTPKKVEVKKEEAPKVEPYKAAKMVEERKNFRPSPIISPVYGVLDKNYKKEDINPRREKQIRSYQREEHLSVDDVRKKAFGTLEDELENTLIGKKHAYIEEEPMETEIDIFKELEDSNLSRSKKNSGLFEETEQDNTVDLTVELQLQKQKIDEIDAYIKENSVKNENTIHSLDKDVNPKKEEIFKNLEEAKEEPQDLDNGDLFDLIDSMYEKRDEI